MQYYNKNNTHTAQPPPFRPPPHTHTGEKIQTRCVPLPRHMCLCGCMSSSIARTDMTCPFAKTHVSCRSARTNMTWRFASTNVTCLSARTDPTCRFARTDTSPFAISGTTCSARTETTRPCASSCLTCSARADNTVALPFKNKIVFSFFFYRSLLLAVSDSDISSQCSETDTSQCS